MSKFYNKVNYQEITDKIIKMMEDGVMPMGSQWKSPRNRRSPFNASSGNFYHGMNVINLWATEMISEYTSNGWLTMLQMRAVGFNDGKPLEVKPKLIVLPEDAPNRAENKTGQKATPVFHGGSFIPNEWKRQDATTFRSDITGDYEDESKLFRSYLKVAGYVFNLDQIQNLPEDYVQFDTLMDDTIRDPQIALMERSYGVPILLSPDSRCFYHPEKDEIRLVHQKDFKTHDDYLRVKFHELIHSTGHYDRLTRFTKPYSPPSKQEYAFEELVAELGAAFMSASFGIKGEMVHASYIDIYIKHLKSDNRAIFKAAAKAQVAADLLLNHINQEEMAA